VSEVVNVGDEDLKPAFPTNSVTVEEPAKGRGAGWNITAGGEAGWDITAGEEAGWNITAGDEVEGDITVKRAVARRVRDRLA
jgi:hypothetical protein